VYREATMELETTLVIIALFVLMVTGNWSLGLTICATLILFEVFRAD